MLGHGAGEVAGEGLAGVGVQALEVEHLAGGEEAHHHVLLGVGQAVHHGVVDQLEEHPVGLGGLFSGHLILHPVGPEAGGEQRPGPLGVGFRQGAHFGAEGFDEIHGGQFLSQGEPASRRRMDGIGGRCSLPGLPSVGGSFWTSAG
mgnify:CR=1 FL=1